MVTEFASNIRRVTTSPGVTTSRPHIYARARINVHDLPGDSGDSGDKSLFAAVLGVTTSVTSCPEVVTGRAERLTRSERAAEEGSREGRACSCSVRELTLMGCVCEAAVAFDCRRSAGRASMTSPEDVAGGLWPAGPTPKSPEGGAQ